jgi:3-methyladenine DNA glycosylase AlkD
VPVQRRIAREHAHVQASDIQKLIKSPWHEERLIALLLITRHFESALKSKNLTRAENIVYLYLANTTYINNWDLVDLTAYKILGRWCWLQNRTIEPLQKLARSANLWEKRIAIVATWHFLREKEYFATLHIATMLLNAPHDLIHKAVGWMLREMGKRDLSVLNAFLAQHYRAMPRTMLRYAIEKHPPAMRRKYLMGEI